MAIDPDVQVLLDAMQAEIDALKAAPPSGPVPDGYTVHYTGSPSVEYVKVP